MEFGAEIDAFPTLRLENGPPGVRNGNRRPEKFETGAGTTVEGRVTCRNSRLPNRTPGYGVWGGNGRLSDR